MKNLLWVVLLLWGGLAAAQPVVVASTSWTAAFADLAGLDGVKSLAPAALAHPPEYELTVSDIAMVTSADILVYAGYERMMTTLANQTKGQKMVKVLTENTLANVETQALAIAELTHTEAVCQVRLISYRRCVEAGRLRVAQSPLPRQKVLVHVMQVPQAKDLGLPISGTFGPGPMTAAQIAEAQKAGYTLIIDNIHNPVSAPVTEVLPQAKIVHWRNFPSQVKRGALEEVTTQNIAALF